MPIYEYKCPEGHLFESFHGMSEPGPDRCEVCGAEPLQRVLHAVAVHYKGSGFYSTDYGRGGRKSRDGDSSGDGGGENASPYKPELQEQIKEVKAKRKESGGKDSGGGVDS
jgi:putative FmdB family regulatory protein